MSYRSFVDDPEALAAATDEARREATVALVEKLGDRWRPAKFDLKNKGIRVAHRPTRLDFVLVSGGIFEMGLSDEDIENASEYIDWTTYVAEWIAEMSKRARPVHSVRVGPFLVARKLLAGQEIERFSSRGTQGEVCDRAAAIEIARAVGARLPSEAEFEWIAREEGNQSFVLNAAKRTQGDRWNARLRSRWDVDDLAETQWMADDWHPTYDGAPSSAAAWLQGEPCGVQRGSLAVKFMQDSEELLQLLAGARRPGGESCRVRLAMDLP